MGRQLCPTMYAGQSVATIKPQECTYTGYQDELELERGTEGKIEEQSKYRQAQMRSELYALLRFHTSYHSGINPNMKVARYLRADEEALDAGKVIEPKLFQEAMEHIEAPECHS